MREITVCRGIYVIALMQGRRNTIKKPFELTKIFHFKITVFRWKLHGLDVKILGPPVKSAFRRPCTVDVFLLTNCHPFLAPIGGIQQLRGPNFTRFWPPPPSRGQKWTFYIPSTLCSDPNPPILVHVIIECPHIALNTRCCCNPEGFNPPHISKVSSV